MPLAGSLVAALLVSLTLAAPQVNYYLLPVGDPRCRAAASRLRCLDHSVLLAATDSPDYSLLDSYLLCNSTWAALGCQQEDTGAVAWRLAFRLAAVPCGQRFVFAASSVNPLQRPWSESGEAAAAGVMEFTCRSHFYPYVHRSEYRFTKLAWHRDSAVTSPAPFFVNISAHVYARFRVDLPPADRPAECDWRGGFWCRAANDSGTGGGCVYGTHRCNGHDDCMDGDDALLSASGNSSGGGGGTSSDELDCGTSRHSGLFDFWPGGGGGGGVSDGGQGGPQPAVLATLLMAAVALCLAAR